MTNKRTPFVRPITRKQPTVNHVTGDKIPKSFVFCRGKLPGPLKHLEMDLRKLMLPYTALKLKEKKRNNLKYFLNVAGPMGVSHFLILSKTETAPYLRVARTPQGPTLTFKILEYALATDIARSQVRPRCPKDLFKNPPLGLAIEGRRGLRRWTPMRPDEPLDDDEVVLKKATEYGAVEIWMNERVRTAVLILCTGFVRPAKKGVEYWLIWKFEGESTLADLVQSKEFPYNVRIFLN
ncbi:hypothetical protein CASFOL_025536 [Castilleja foliolosa]|uniref:Brix domain-containing protein n=1 Tax=Castilleja foliolosa TaxID=1961234 RepID=A0ABD3CVF7_9LAMI